MSISKDSPIIIKLPSDTGDTKGLQAFAVDSNGSVVATAPFDGDQASISPLKSGQKWSRIFIAPAFPADYPATKINAQTLAATGAYQVPLQFSAQNTLTIQNLPSEVIKRPIFSRCDITGNVTNTITLNGQPYTGPVCQARVHICQVEWRFRWPIYLQRPIPQSVLTELQNRLINVNVPLPGPGPVEELRKAALPENVYSEILGATTDSINAVVLKYHEILYPYFCRWPFFWDWFYYLSPIATVLTDCNGHFDESVYRIPGIEENIYVWVEANVNGTWVTVYNPPFPCNTHWDYACGSDINISLAVPNIPPCSCEVEAQEGSVWFTGIGEYGIALNIQQDDTHAVTITQPTTLPVPPQSVTIFNVGCTNLFDSNQLCPFGNFSTGLLEFNLAFGVNTPSGTTPGGAVQQATHYRWEVTPIKDSNLHDLPSPTTSVITSGEVSRTYLWEDLSTGDWHGGSIFLQDKDINGAIAYQIPDYLVTSYPASYGIPADAEWQSFNFTSSYFDTNSIPNGYLVRFDLQLLYNDPVLGFQQLSVVQDSSFSTFTVSVDTSYIDGSVGAPGPYLTPDPSNPSNALGLTLKVRIDNSAVNAQINDVLLLNSDGTPAPGGSSGPCGFINYTDVNADVDISFVATEAYNFAKFSFEIWKGSSGYVSAVTQDSDPSYVFSNIGIYTLSGGTFSADVPIPTLLGTCINNAAFGGSLSVASLATDGNGLPLSAYGSAPYYDSSVIAFALSNT